MDTLKINIDQIQAFELQAAKSSFAKESEILESWMRRRASPSIPKEEILTKEKLESREIRICRQEGGLVWMEQRGVRITPILVNGVVDSKSLSIFHNIK